MFRQLMGKTSLRSAGREFSDSHFAFFWKTVLSPPLHRKGTWADPARLQRDPVHMVAVLGGEVVGEAAVVYRQGAVFADDFYRCAIDTNW
jgi:hypothetical protein